MEPRTDTDALSDPPAGTPQPEMRTSLTLLQSLTADPGNQTAWGQFVTRYQPLILQWCKRRGLDENDAADVAQDVMTRLARVMDQFQYDPSKSFRAWLSTVTKHAWLDWCDKEKRHRRTDDSHILRSVEARDDLVERLQQEYDAELMELAVLRVRMRVSEQNWKAFELTAIDGMSGAQAAESLGIPVGRVFVDKSRITKMLSAEIRRLEPATDK
ncbi:MAG: sigma-70 family RNA polymerase sigma factor [Aureliella sp.]